MKATWLNAPLLSLLLCAGCGDGGSKSGTSSDKAASATDHLDAVAKPERNGFVPPSLDEIESEPEQRLTAEKFLQSTNVPKWEDTRKLTAEEFLDFQPDQPDIFDRVTEEQKAFNKTQQRAEEGDMVSQNVLGAMYFLGQGVTQDRAAAAKWYRKAAEQGEAAAQLNLASSYIFGQGVQENFVEAYKWVSLAVVKAKAYQYFKLGGVSSIGDSRFANLNGVNLKEGDSRRFTTPAGEIQIKLISAKPNEVLVECNGDDGQSLRLQVNTDGGAGSRAIELRKYLEEALSPSQIAEGRRLASEFKPRQAPKAGSIVTGKAVVNSRPIGSGTGFFISADGFLVTNEHVVRDATQVRLVTSKGLIAAKVVKVDADNDLALLKAEGKFSPLAVVSSHPVRLGATVATVGFPNPLLQGFAPKQAKGDIASLSGAEDDARYFQISVPVQPGNSGGALVDERGNAVGVVSAKLDAVVALKSSGSLPENVNYAVKSSFLLNFLESVPEVSAKLKKPETKERKFEDVVDSATQATALVLVY